MTFDDDTTTYVPNFNTLGQDSYTYTITDVNGDSSTAAVVPEPSSAVGMSTLVLLVLAVAHVRRRVGG